MKQVSVNRLILVLILLPGFVCVDCLNAAGEIITPVVRQVSLNGDSLKIEGFTKDFNSTHDFSGGYAIRVNPVSSSGPNFIHVKQIPPVWGRILITKQPITIAGFFFPAMVILLFFIFYQNSRTGSESDTNYSYES